MGVEYLCDYTADDHPFPFNVKKGSLISVPYTVELNDIPAFQNVGISSEAFGDAIVDQFDVLYDEGADNARCMPICLHTFWVGQPNKFKHLKRAFAHIASHKDVWLDHRRRRQRLVPQEHQAGAVGATPQEPRCRSHAAGATPQEPRRRSHAVGATP